MGWYIGLGTIPIGVFGLVFSDQIESGARSLYLVGTTLIVLGLVLLLAEKVAKHEREIEDINGARRRVIGFAQAAALVPGVSRSGATITAGLFSGFDRASAARYSLPAVRARGRALRAVRDAQDRRRGRCGLVQTALATIAAFIVGYASIAWLLRWLANHSMMVFVVYRVALGVTRDRAYRDGRLEVS